MAFLFEPPTNVTDATGMVSWINSTTSLWLFQGIISSLFVISLITMLKNPSNTASKAFSSASFITMIVAVLARTIDLVSTTFMTLWIVLVGLGAIWMYIEGVGA